MRPCLKREGEGKGKQRREEGEEAVLFLRCFLLVISPVYKGPSHIPSAHLAVPYLCSGPRPSPSHQPTCTADTTLNVLRGFLMLSLGTALCVSRDGCQRNSGSVVCVNGQTGGVERGEVREGSMNRCWA